MITDTSKAVAAYVRSVLAARRCSQRDFAPVAGLSPNYLAVRLRDERPFTVDELEALARLLGNGCVSDFIAKAVEEYQP